ncbi:MAG TPA: heparinase II/III family protein [Rhizomicrobium sp.]
MRGRRSTLSLLNDIAAALWQRTLRPLRVFWRRSWMYGLRLKGRLPDRIVVHPDDFAVRRLDQADALLRGRFRFAGETVEATQGSIFDYPQPSVAWVEALHAFEWLSPLSGAGGEPARMLAVNLTSQWLRRNARYSEPAWRADILGRRLLNLFAHSRFMLTKSDVLWRSKLFVSLREQARMLARISKDAPEGLPRLEAATAHALCGVCLNDGSHRLEGGLARLDSEVAAQILPDGGHANRSPEALLSAYRQLAMVSSALDAAGSVTPEALLNARARMAPMLRFFRLGDGALAQFNGGGEGDAKMISALLARDEVRGQPFAFAPHSGYQRLAAGRTLLVLDCGYVPEGPFAKEAHAGCLSFEFSTGNQRVVVNCGAARDEATWGGALRATAAHSTVTLADRSMATVMGGTLAKLLGPRLVGGPQSIETSRHETASGWTMDASHDAYVPLFGIVHQRRLTLSPNGTMLSGIDRLTRTVPRRGRENTPFAARFHIHPDIRVSPNQGGGAILKLASGEGWRFQAAGGTLSIEESIYLGNGSPRRAEQLVVSGAVHHEPVEIDWVFERLGAA